MRAALLLCIAILAFGVAIFVFVVCIFLTQTPQLWAALVLASLCFLALRSSRKMGTRLLWWNCGVILAVWALFEGAALVWMGGTLGPMVPRAALAPRLGRLFPFQLNVTGSVEGYRLAPAHHEEGGVA